MGGGIQLNSNQIQGAETRQKAYSLNKFLDDCKNHKDLVEIEPDAQDEASNVMHINCDSTEKTKVQILDQIALHGENEFEYINTKPFRKGINGDHPLVDAYRFNHAFINIYISFCIVRTKNGWYVKSIHADGSHSGFGDSMSIGEMIKLIGKK